MSQNFIDPKKLDEASRALTKGRETVQKLAGTGVDQKILKELSGAISDSYERDLKGIYKNVNLAEEQVTSGKPKAGNPSAEELLKFVPTTLEETKKVYGGTGLMPDTTLSESGKNGVQNYNGKIPG